MKMHNKSSFVIVMLLVIQVLNYFTKNSVPLIYDSFIFYIATALIAIFITVVCYKKKWIKNIILVYLLPLFLTIYLIPITMNLSSFISLSTEEKLVKIFEKEKMIHHGVIYSYRIAILEDNRSALIDLREDLNEKLLYRVVMYKGILGIKYLKMPIRFVPDVSGRVSK